RSPEAIVSVPPAIIVRLPETLAAELTVTLTPAPITTASVQAGTTPVLHVAGAFQLPEATAVKFRSVDDIPNVSPVAAVTSAVLTPLLCAAARPPPVAT